MNTKTIILGLLFLNLDLAVSQTLSADTEIYGTVEIEKLKKLVIDKKIKYDSQLAYFDPSSFFKEPLYEFKYDLTKDNSLVISDLFKFNSQTFTFKYGNLKDFYPNVNRDKRGLFISWPQKIVEFERLELLTGSGNVHYSHIFNNSEIVDWNKKIKIAAGVSHYFVEDFFNKSLGQSDFSGTYRFCLSTVKSEHFIRVCSSRYRVGKKNDQFAMAPIPETITAKAFVLNQTAKLSDRIPIPNEKMFRFFAELSSGESIEFLTSPPTTTFLDGYKDNEVAFFYGVGEPPLGHSLSPAFPKKGLQKIYISKENDWLSAVPRGQLYVYAQGSPFGVFQRQLVFEKLNTNTDRLFYSHRRPEISYLEKFEAKVLVNPTIKVRQNNQEIQLKFDKNNKSDSVMNSTRLDQATLQLKSSKDYDYFENQFEYEMENKKYSSLLRVYKEPHRQLTYLQTGSLSSQGIIFFSQIKYKHWFQDLFRSLSDRYSFLRWGVSGTYVRSLTPFSVNGMDKKTFQALDLNLLYRWEQGLEFKTPTLGTLIGIRSIDYSEVHANLIGLGGFYQSLIPGWLEYLTPPFEFFDDPKYIHLQLTYYPSTLTKQTTLTTNIQSELNLILHKKTWSFNIGGNFHRFGVNSTDENLSLNVLMFNIGASKLF